MAVIVLTGQIKNHIPLHIKHHVAASAKRHEIQLPIFLLDTFYMEHMTAYK